MSKKQTADDANKEAIIEVVKNQNPQTTQELIKIVAEKTSLDEEEITKLLVELENEDKLRFTKKETSLPSTAREYLFSMKPAWYWLTIAVAVATSISVLIIPENVYPIVYLRSTLGILFVLFLPGYAFIKALFPSAVPIKTGSENLDNIERVALSIGMSLALVPLVGFVLNYTPWGIRLTPITLSLLALTGAFANAAVLREYQAKATKQV